MQLVILCFCGCSLRISHQIKKKTKWRIQYGRHYITKYRQRPFMKIKTMQVVVLYVFEGVLSEYHAKFSKNKMADPIWRPSFHQISFLKIISMKVVILYVFEGAQSKYHIRFEENKMVNPIWPPLYHQIPFLKIKAM